jgi:hypothetical protein
LSLYELAILGDLAADDRAGLAATVQSMVEDFGLKIGTDIVIHDATSVVARDKRAAFAGAYFGGNPSKDLRAVEELLRSSAPVIPTIATAGNFATQIPPVLHFSNGLRRRADDPEMNELAAALLECVGLLRKQRRVFVSYRRIESRSAAMQLHDLLSSRGFDVFLDTHDVRPGEPFQDVLWHRLCDSDVMIMLDTPTYFESKWTRQELGRARAKEIHVLRAVWPDHVANTLTALAETIYLNAADLRAADGPLIETTADRIALAVERLRSKSIASRYMSITGKLRADVERIGGSIVGIGAHRAIAIQLDDKRRVWAYPVVGIPTAELLNDVAEKARRADQTEIPILVYDHVGISDAWINHLKWLDDNITAVRAIKSSEVSWQLAAWEAKT